MHSGKKIRQSSEASIEFARQKNDADYLFLAMTDTSRIKLDAAGTLVDSKGREPLAVLNYDLTQGVYSNIDLYELAQGTLELIGGGVPKGMQVMQMPTGDVVPCCCLDATIAGVPSKAKQYTALLRVTNGVNKKRIIQVNFTVKPLGNTAGLYYGVLYREGENEDPDEIQYRQLGWLKLEVGTDGTVSAKAKIDGLSYKFSDDAGIYDIRTNEEESCGLYCDWAEGSLYGNKVINGESAWMSLDFQLPKATANNWNSDADCGNGYLTLTVGEDGAVTYAGLLADGTAVSGTTVAQVQGWDHSDPDDCTLMIPLSFTYSEYTWDHSYLGGVIALRFRETSVAGVRNNASFADVEYSGVLDWNRDNLYPRAIRLTPVGGYYNTIYNLQTYYLGFDFALRAASADDTSFIMNINQFASLPSGVKSCNFVRETGVVSGKFFDEYGIKRKYNAINLLNKRDAKLVGDDIFATGFYFLDSNSSYSDLFDIELRKAE